MDKPDKHILCVEDDRAMGRLFQRKFEKLGYRVTVETNGESGLGRAQEGGCDLIVVDYELPGLSGLEIIRALASSGEHAPVIMMTASGSEELAVEAIKWGAADYIVKDWKFLDLMPTVVEQVLDQSRVWEEKRIAEEALRRSQATQAAILDAIPDGLMQLDGEGIVLQDRVSRIDFPFLPINGEGRSLVEIFPRSVAALLKEKQRIAAASRCNQTVEFATGIDREERFYETRLVPYGQDEMLLMIRDVSATVLAAREREHLIADLKEALSRIKTMSGLLPMCSKCKKIRDDDGYWNQLEIYIQKNSDAAFSHSYCPDCIKEEFPEFYVEGKYR